MNFKSMTGGLLSLVAAAGVMLLAFQNCSSSGVGETNMRSMAAIQEAFPSISSVEPIEKFRVEGRKLLCDGHCMVTFQADAGKSSEDPVIESASMNCLNDREGASDDGGCVLSMASLGGFSSILCDGDLTIGDSKLVCSKDLVLEME